MNSDAVYVVAYILTESFGFVKHSCNNLLLALEKHGSDDDNYPRLSRRWCPHTILSSKFSGNLDYVQVKTLSALRTMSGVVRPVMLPVGKLLHKHSILKQFCLNGTEKLMWLIPKDSWGHISHLETANKCVITLHQWELFCQLDSPVLEKSSLTF